MRVHRNLHNARRGGPQWVETRKGRVAQYLETVRLGNVSTRIQPGGAATCKAKGVRSVVAFFDGIQVDEITVTTGWQRIGYDPRVDSSFWTTGEDNVRRPFTAAAAVELRADGSAWAFNPTITEEK